MENEIQLATESRPVEMINLAIEKGADLDKLEKLLIMKERWEANEARKAYHEAMAKFKADPPKIFKDKTVGYESRTGGSVGYKHASLGNVVEKISSALSIHGLSASWSTQQNGKVVVTCRITHRRGHSEETTLSADADTSGSKNSIQAIGSTISYLERYTILALTGLATYDQDDDGQAATTEYIDEKQLSTLIDMMNEKDIKEERLLKYLKIETLEQLPSEKYQLALTAIQNTKGGAK